MWLCAQQSGQFPPSVWKTLSGNIHFHFDRRNGNYQPFVWIETRGITCPRFVAVFLGVFGVRKVVAQL